MGCFINGQKTGMPYINGCKCNAYINGKKIWNARQIIEFLDLSSIDTSEYPILSTSKNQHISIQGKDDLKIGNNIYDEMGIGVYIAVENPGYDWYVGYAVIDRETYEIVYFVDFGFDIIAGNYLLYLKVRFSDGRGVINSGLSVSDTTFLGYADNLFHHGETPTYTVSNNNTGYTKFNSDIRVLESSKLIVAGSIERPGMNSGLAYIIQSLDRGVSWINIPTIGPIEEIGMQGNIRTYMNKYEGYDSIFLMIIGTDTVSSTLSTIKTQNLYMIENDGQTLSQPIISQRRDNSTARIRINDITILFVDKNHVIVSLPINYTNQNDIFFIFLLDPETKTLAHNYSIIGNKIFMTERDGKLIVAAEYSPGLIKNMIRSEDKGITWTEIPIPYPVDNYDVTQKIHTFPENAFNNPYLNIPSSNSKEIIAYKGFFPAINMPTASKIMTGQFSTLVDMLNESNVNVDLSQVGGTVTGMKSVEDTLLIGLDGQTSSGDIIVTPNPTPDYRFIPTSRTTTIVIDDSDNTP